MALWKCTIVIIVLYIWGCNSQSQDKVDQHTRIQSAFEGDTVKIDCTYQTAYTNPTLFWYQQKDNGNPKHMLNKFSKSGNSEEEFKERFHANLSTTSVPLSIMYLRVSDSAVYYCALRPTVTETHSTLIQNLKQCDIIMQFNLIFFSFILT
uniref:Ig-like domain-containing protein n=1 Tax=Cyprinus carpio TaxID=7962 RepID=A0A8C2FB34_CYPCA